MANVKKLEDAINKEYPDYFAHYPNKVFSFKHMRNEDLQSTVLSAAVVRLRLALDPANIPDTDIGRARWWKENYNTWHPSATGTVKKYLDSLKSFRGRSGPNVLRKVRYHTEPVKRSNKRKSFTTEILELQNKTDE